MLSTLLSANVAHCVDLSFAWDKNTESDLAGYYIYYKTGSSGAPYDGTGADEGNSPIKIPIVNLNDPENPEYTIHGLSDTEASFFVITAYDTANNESDYSNELSFLNAHNDTATVMENSGPTNINVTANDDFGGDGPAAADISITSGANNGSASVNNGGSPNDPTDDSIDYTPNLNFNGTDTLTYQICDSYGDCDTAILTVTVTVNDNCPDDPNKTEPGVCGCGIPDADSDLDGTLDCNDNCPNDPNKTEPGICGCGVSDIDTDSDGTLDCNDNCPTDPNKISPGICGCGIADTDSDNDGSPDCNDNCDNLIDTDGDGTADCNDNCPNDSNKTDLGICGCGVADIDTDSDGTLDCNDNCPTDPNKISPGICGCGVADTDSDSDGTLDCADTNDDNDSLSDLEEQGPGGNAPNYDGNNDGIADRLQNNVASFHTYDGQKYVTMASPVGTTINNPKAVANPSATDAPLNVRFSYGFFEFTINGVNIGGPVAVTLYFPSGVNFDTYYKFGLTSANKTKHWYEFLYDSQTGAEIDGNVIKLHFVDGARGDDDLTANGKIVDVGAPAVAVTSSDGGGGGTTVATGDGGGGGCFVATAAYGSLMEPQVLILREFRDRFMLSNVLGKGFVRLYYTYSPPIAKFIAKHDSLRAMVRISLLPVVGVSWIALKIGPLSTVTLMLTFISCFVGLVWFRRRYRE